MPIANSAGVDIYYEVHGEGAPVTLINGLGAEVSEYAHFARPFAESHKLLVFDNRGAGRSDKPDSPYTIEMMAADATSVMRAAGIERSHIVGISMGGRVAIELALQHPEMVDKLVLVSTGARVQRSLKRTLLTRSPPQFLYRGKHPQPRYAFLHQRKASQSYDATERIHAIKAPTLIMHGRKDGIAPLALANEMHDRIDGSTLETFRGGHLFFLMRSRQEFGESLLRFLA